MVLEGKVKARVLGLLRQRAVDDGGLVGSLQCKRSTAASLPRHKFYVDSTCFQQRSRRLAKGYGLIT
jgi:hypothetical protein